MPTAACVDLAEPDVSFDPEVVALFVPEPELEPELVFDADWEPVAESEPVSDAVFVDFGAVVADAVGEAVADAVLSLRCQHVNTGRVDCEFLTISSRARTICSSYN